MDNDLDLDGTGALVAMFAIPLAALALVVVLGAFGVATWLFLP